MKIYVDKGLKGKFKEPKFAVEIIFQFQNQRMKSVRQIIIYFNHHHTQKNETFSHPISIRNDNLPQIVITFA